MPAPGGETTTGQAIVIVRTIHAARELVWKAWTEPEHFMRWWGPKDFTSPHCSIDLRVGGRYLNCMRSPRGRELWTTGVYREIVEPERIVYTDSWCDEQGTVVPGTRYGFSADFPLESLVTVTLADLGGKTRMTMTHAGLTRGDDFDTTENGWLESFDKLADSVR
jgi:uncharacterized protein YndB with AHSA1/START domain